MTLWVLHVISNVREGLPVYTQRRTYRRVALSEATGHYRKWPAYSIASSGRTCSPGDTASPSAFAVKL